MDPKIWLFFLFSSFLFSFFLLFLRSLLLFHQTDLIESNTKKKGFEIDSNSYLLLQYQSLVT